MRKISTGTGTTLERAIESALDSSKFPQPYQFEVLWHGGHCTPEKRLYYEVRVSLWAESIEETAERRREGREG